MKCTLCTASVFKEQCLSHTQRSIGWLSIGCTTYTSLPYTGSINRYTLLDGLPEVQLKVNNLAEYIMFILRV